MRKSILLVLVLMLSPVIAINPAAEGGTGRDARAGEILEQARTALGGTALSDVQGMIMVGKYRRVISNQDQSGETELRILLPDKFMRAETMTVVGSIEVTLIKALNGNQAWADSSTNSAGGQVQLIRPQGSASADAALARDLRADFARNLISLLLEAPPSLSIEFSYVGTANAGDAQTDVIDARGLNGFEARVFLDKKTHLPLMLTYQGVAARNAIASSSSGSGGDIKKMVEEVRKKSETASRDQRESSVSVYFGDYRREGGILLPHRFTQSINGKTVEEFEVTKVKINPKSLTAAKFEKGSK